MNPETLSSWQVWAVLSAVFAALTAIFAKVGVEDINPDLATFIRTIIVLISFSLILFATGQFSHPGPISQKSWIFLVLSGLGIVAVLFPRAEAWTGDAGGADRQIERGAGGVVRRGVSRRAAFAQWMARNRADCRRRGANCIQALTTPRPITPRRQQSAQSRRVREPTAAA
jgi:EamA-like transporter family